MGPLGGLFAGQATDPGTNDQSTLDYAWDFGDGTPVAGGPNASHTYAVPAGGYDATLTVCDKDAGCSSDVRRVFLTKRATTTTYTGDVSSGPNTTVDLSAMLVDSTGTPLAGKTIAFELGDQSASAVTNGSGVAVTTRGSSRRTASLRCRRRGRRTAPTACATWDRHRAWSTSSR